MNKKGMSIALGIFMSLVIVFLMTSLYLFNVREADTQDILYAPGVVDEVYIEEVGLNYYLDNIFEKSVDSFKYEYGKQEFIDNFKENLKRYEVVDELDSIEGQLVEDNIELTSESIILRLEIEIEKSMIKDDDEVLRVNYKYERRFEKVFK